MSGGKSRGGAPASSGGKGNATSGGAIGMGGASVTPPESCRLFCRELVADCGVVLRLNDMVCRSTCVDGFNGRTGVCEQLRISALGCIQNALARPMASCDDMSRIISMDCVVPLTLAAACGR